MIGSTPQLLDFEDAGLTKWAVDELAIPLELWRRGHRKWWEWARVLDAASVSGALRADARILGIGSGHETPLFWFCNRVRTVVATDLYGKTPFGNSEASDAMLVDPVCFAPFPYERAALIVERVDARDLPFGSESFDFAFSCSSVEHFGCDSDIVRAMREAFRVLKPGGTYALSVDYLFDPGSGRVRGRNRRRGLLGELIARDEVSPLLVESAGFELAEDLRLTVDSATSFVALDRSKAPNEEYPHLWLTIGDAKFTSLFLMLRKPASASLTPLPSRAHLLGL